ncbi:MarR family winged helix-turn-helix transcriptional regulator [Tuwongella immobilis]|uniref:MarR family winged helix-turn-helix transcriptional regulator n=1 Tax=Tuwongella immobilis TaxID=692036 RepID=UPI001E2BBEAE
MLEYLGDRDMRMMRELAEFLVLAVNSVTNIIDNLEKRSLVRRTRSDEDRRVVLVELTETGKTIYNRLAVHKQDFLQKLLSSLEPSEHSSFMLSFTRMVETGRAVLGLKAPTVTPPAAEGATA